MNSSSSIVLTGGTGSFGSKFIPMTIEKYQPKRISVVSRDEMKQWQLSQKLERYGSKVKFFIGDVRDKDRLKRVLDGNDIAIHAAATKIVPIAEYNPFECIKTNINGAANLIEAALDTGIEKVVALSTDKASNPINLYGATKLASDKLFIAANEIENKNSTSFSIVRYGNVMGSRGSVIPFFINQAKNNLISITDSRMTRFMITLEEGIELVWHALDDMQGGEIYVKKIPSMNITDIAKAVSESCKKSIVGIRPGEKIHEQMIGFEDAPYTYEYNNYYKILPMLNCLYKDERMIKDGKLVDPSFTYNSNNNNKWKTIEELRKWISEEYSLD